MLVGKAVEAPPPRGLAEGQFQKAQGTSRESKVRPWELRGGASTLVAVVFPHLSGSVKRAQLTSLTGWSSGRGKAGRAPPSWAGAAAAASHRGLSCRLVGMGGPEREGGPETGNRGDPH